MCESAGLGIIYHLSFIIHHNQLMNFEPLKGIKILDLTTVFVGPIATWRLGQYGAEIIKVENPTGDLMRGLGGMSPTGQHSGAYLHLNHGKKNICLDLKRGWKRNL
jgi:crotonobetainyl-CoA:carnitine CoA-transferase CaiB-like acyl-CoA transferase